MHSITVIAPGIAASLALALAVPAQPAEGGITAQRQIVLQYRGGDLATPAGLERTYQRMSLAAGLVCQPYAGRELNRQRIFQRCLDASLAAAVAELHDARLSALHDSRTPATPAGRPLRTALR